jgi:1-hydroxycarotenoid 3,4-desaturase
MGDVALASRDHRVVVIGAGVGGLVSALLLARRGLDVTLVEAAAAPGGKMRQLQVDGAPIDAGPTVFTMRWVFEQIFASVGTSLSAELSLQPLGVLARHAWRGRAGRDHHPNTDRLDLLADKAASADAIARFAGPAEARRFLAFCDEARRVYERLEAPHIRAQRPNLLSMARGLGPAGLATLAGLGPFATLAGRLARHFREPRLQQLFGRYATYCGTSPWAAPATLMLVAHVEQSGVWSVRGGMHEVARVLARLAQARGARFIYGQRCTQIDTHAGRVSAVHLASGQVLPADSVIFNGDANALASGLLGESARAAAAPVPVPQRSLSALTWAVHAPTHGFPLVRHNVFFDDDYASEFDDVFRQRRLPRRGTVYVCAQDRDDSAAIMGAASGSAERLLCLVNAPADGDHHPLDPSETLSCQNRSLALLQHCGLQMEPQPHQLKTTTPADFNQLFPATGGALYGPASQGWMAVFRRSGSTTPIPGLLLAGGSVHPGPGVPMAAMSGCLAAETLLAHLDSTSPSRRAAISGGISTPSATTVDTA